MTFNSNWYEQLEKEKSLQQGEIINNLPILIPPQKIDLDKDNKFQIKPIITKKNVVILSQSCDLEQNKVKIITLCSFENLLKLQETNPTFKSIDRKEDLRRGYFPYLHLLDMTDDINSDNEFLVVNFREIYTANNEYLKDFVSKQNERISLKSPYIEHLSQSFARFFMRVGLPSTIKPFKK